MLADAPDLNPVDERQTADPFAAVFCPALRTALQEVSAEWAPQWAASSEGESSIDHALMCLSLRLGRVGDGSVLHENDGGRETLDRADLLLLAAIRRSLLEQWRRNDLFADQNRVLALLHSIDLLAEEPLIGGGGPDDSEPPPTETEAFRLVAEVAHDLRSPLTSILFLSEALRNGQSGSLTELQKHQLGLIYAAALGLAGVTNDLMTIAQKQTLGHLDEAVAFSLHEMFEAVREMVAPQAEAKRIRLRFGAQCTDHRHGHPGRIGRVLLNLTTNAIRFTPEGGSVEVLADPLARDTVQISVRDTGQGIPPEQMARLYEPFQKFQGREGFFFAASGLGLSIVRRLLEGLDSELTVDSKVGQGTRFSFVLSLPTPP